MKDRMDLGVGRQGEAVGDATHTRSDLVRAIETRSQLVGGSSDQGLLAVRVQFEGHIDAMDSRAARKVAVDGGRWRAIKGLKGRHFDGAVEAGVVPIFSPVEQSRPR